MAKQCTVVSASCIEMVIVSAERYVIESCKIGHMITHDSLKNILVEPQSSDNSTALTIQSQRLPHTVDRRLRSIFVQYCCHHASHPRNKVEKEDSPSHSRPRRNPRRSSRCSTSEKTHRIQGHRGSTWTRRILLRRLCQVARVARQLRLASQGKAT